MQNDAGSDDESYLPGASGSDASSAFGTSNSVSSEEDGLFAERSASRTRTRTRARRRGTREGVAPGRSGDRRRRATPTSSRANLARTTRARAVATALDRAATAVATPAMVVRVSRRPLCASMRDARATCVGQRGAARGGMRASATNGARFIGAATRFRGG
eukprot:30069-Pelagococcus_subviridis.AAC.3